MSKYILTKKGFVAVDNCGYKTSLNPSARRVMLFSNLPVRDFSLGLHYWTTSRGGCIILDEFSFPSISWEDEPRKVELRIISE